MRGARVSRRSSWRVARESSAWSSSRQSSSSFLLFPTSWRPQSRVTPGRRRSRGQRAGQPTAQGESPQGREMVQQQTARAQ
eukprot:1985445-Pyramimonas_sp.AAC.1